MAAYRAAARLNDERRNGTVDYRRRAGVAHSEIMTPEGSAPWLRQREALWNYVERIEGRCDAQLAREINLALPHEVSDADRLELVRAFVSDEFVALGMVADFAIHHPVPEKGDDPRNYHAHILLTLRQATPDGLCRVKTRAWNSDVLLVKWRASWAERQNRLLHQRGRKERVDHRSLAAMKADASLRNDPVQAFLLDRVPEIHVGPKARKAGKSNSPPSKERKVGPVRTWGRRTVHYPIVDKGSRGSWNLRQLRRNIEDNSKRIARTEQRLARLRARQERYERRLKAHSSHPGRDELRHRPQAGAVDVAGLVADRRTHEHLRRRREQVAWLIHELNVLFLALLHLRESQLVRETVWRNRMARWRYDALVPIRFGGRQRLRSRV